MARLLLAGLLTFAAGLASCGAESAPRAEALQLQPRSAGLLQRLADRALSTAHRGVRSYESHVYVDGADRFVAYVEDVADRGDGCYSIVPRDVESNLVHPVLFRGLQLERQAFTRLYRDFRIRDLDAFLENYTVEDRGEVREVAGRECVVLHVTPRDEDVDRRIELAVDPESALALGVREERRDGTLLSSLVYSSLELGVEPGGVDCFENEIHETPLAAGTDLSAELGFEVWRPALLPDGYEFLERSLLEDPTGRPWVKWTFTDGVEPLFFVQRGPAPVDDGTVRMAGPGELGLAGAELGNRVLVFEEADLSVVQGHLDDTEVIAAGRVPVDDLLLLLDASRP